MQFVATDVENHVHIPSGDVSLGAMLAVPQNATQVVIFAHGSGSSRFSTRNNFVAEVLRAHGFAILLMDLLTASEDLSVKSRGDVDLQAGRIISARAWIRKQESFHDLKIGLFGVGTGAAAAMKVTAMLGNEIGALVTRNGRPDLAGDALLKITSPTLLIVGGNGPADLERNQTAFQKLTCVKAIEIVEGASHVFDEPGTIDQVAYFANAWFKKYLLNDKPSHLAA